MRRELVRISLLIFTLLHVELAGAKPTPPVEIDIAAAHRIEGSAVETTITARFLVRVERVRVTIRSIGVVGDHPFMLERTGSWAAGGTLTIPWTAHANSQGEGSFAITIEALDASGATRFSRTRELHVLSERDVLWTSPSSPTHLRLQRIDHLSRRGAISAEEREALERQVFTARAIADHEPRPAAVWTPLQHKIQRRLGARIQPAQESVVAPQAAVAIAIRGRVEWTDRNGVTHGLPLATVEIRDSELIGSDLVTTVTTDAAGDYSAAVNHDDGALQGNPDIFVRVLARSPVADVKPDGLFGSTYMLESPVQNEVPNDSSLIVNLTARNTTDAEAAFSVHHALVVIGAYAGTLTGRTPSRVDTRFPTNLGNSKFTGQIHLLRGDRWDWDVIHHEYGHYVMSIHGFADNPGGSHDFGVNNAQNLGKSGGIRIAWGEGWPSFFAISGQHAMGVAALGVPDAGNVRYQDTEDTAIDQNVESQTGVGEDDELSVLTALWDLFDGATDGADVVALGDRALFNAVKGAGAKTAGAAWEAIAATQDTREKTLVGAIFGQSRIAPELIDPADNVTITAGGTAPTFRWKKNGGGAPNPLNDFRIVFYSNDFSSMIFQKEMSDTDQFTPTAAELATILGSGTPVKWVVEGKNLSTPVTPGGALGRYWSGPRTIGGVSIAFVIDDTGSMTEEIDGVRSALQTFIDGIDAKLAAGATPPTIQLITFKDDVTSRIISNDLAAVRSAVASLTASGGGDCPEFSAHAVQFAATNISPGGTILLATDAAPQPGVAMGAVISGLRARGVTVNTILSGDCSGISSTALIPGRPSTMAAGIQDNEGVSQGPSKPGGDDPPQPPISDPGQPPVDDHGDTQAHATTLPDGGPALSGIVGAQPGDVDFFRLPVTVGEMYVVAIALTSAGSATFQLLDGDGAIVGHLAAENLSPRQIVFTPETAGDHFLRVETGAPATAYEVSLRNDPFAALFTAVEMFSTVSLQTGGAFLVRDEVNDGDTAAYEAAILNVLTSTLGPTVLASNPAELPAGQTITVNLTGRRTNWRSNSAVQFSGTGVSVAGVTVTSATELQVTVNVAIGATFGLRDVEVSTPLGSSTEVARGEDVVEIVGALSTPALLSIEPAFLSRGETRAVRIRGANTAWTASSSLSLGPKVQVLSLQFVSATELVATVQVSDDAAIGFRTAAVTTTGAGTQSRLRAVFIESAIVALPVITGVSPPEGTAGETLTVTVAGMTTNFEAGVTTASFGSGITVLQVTVIDADTAEVTIQIAADATAGFRDVILTTGSEVAVLPQGFFVNEAATAAVPLSPLGLMALAALLGLGGLWILRR